MQRKTTSTTKSGTTKSGTTRTTRAKKTDVVDLEGSKKEDLLSQIKIDLKHKNETQKKLTQAIKKDDVVICVGPAGTGKTLLSVAESLLLLKNKPDVYHEIKLVKSIVQLKDEDLGTLPGDEKDKLKFIMMSFLDAFYQLIGEELTGKLINAGYIKMEVFGALRGRSFKNCIILFDEFQNVNDNNGKTLLTRFSDETKVVALGDSNQVDLKNPELSCLAELIRMSKKYPEQGVGIVEFNENEVVRHRLTKYFIQLFENPEYKKKDIVVKKIREKPIKKKTIIEKIKEFFKQ